VQHVYHCLGRELDLGNNFTFMKGAVLAGRKHERSTSGTTPV